METTFKREVNHTYMEIQMVERFDEDSFSLRILSEQKVEGILSPTILHVDDLVRAQYDITGLTPLVSFIRNDHPSGEECRRLIYVFLHSLMAAEDYLLELHHLMVDEEHTYVDRNRGNIYVPYVPGAHGDLMKSLVSLFERIVKLIPEEGRETNLMFNRLLREMRREETHLQDLCDFMDREEHEEHMESGTVPSWDERTEEEESKEEDGQEKKKLHFLVWPMAGVLSVIGLMGVLYVLLHLHILTDPFTAGMILGGGVLILIGIQIAGLIRSRKEKKKTEDDVMDRLFEEELSEPEAVFETPHSDRLSLSLKGMKHAKRIRKNETKEGKEGKEEKKEKRERKEDRREQGKEERELGEETVLLADVNETMLLYQYAYFEATQQEDGMTAADELSDDSGKSIRMYLTGQSMIIGSRRNSDLVISCPYVSRNHARVIRDGGSYSLMDLGSKNGTAIDEKMLVPREAYPLHHGQMIWFADRQYRFVDPEEEKLIHRDA